MTAAVNHAAAMVRGREWTVCQAGAWLQSKGYVRTSDYNYIAKLLGVY